MEDINKQLVKYKNKHNLKAWELARKLNTPESNVSRWLKGGKISYAWTRLIQQIINE